MTDTTFALSYTHEDLELLPPERLAVRLRVSRAFVTLCLDCGCLARPAGRSAAELMQWLFRNYATVRTRCGLPPCAPVDGVKGIAYQRLVMANAVLTLLEFGAMRASDLDEKRQLRRIIDYVVAAADRN